MGVRVYHPGARTFLQPDPLLPMKYDYTDGDPVNRVDPTSLSALSGARRATPHPSATRERLAHWGFAPRPEGWPRRRRAGIPMTGGAEGGTIRAWALLALFWIGGLLALAGAVGGAQGWGGLAPGLLALTGSAVTLLAVIKMPPHPLRKTVRIMAVVGGLVCAAGMVLALIARSLG